MRIEDVQPICIIKIIPSNPNLATWRLSILLVNTTWFLCKTVMQCLWAHCIVLNWQHCIQHVKYYLLIIPFISRLCPSLSSITVNMLYCIANWTLKFTKKIRIHCQMVKLMFTCVRSEYNWWAEKIRNSEYILFFIIRIGSHRFYAMRLPY